MSFKNLIKKFPGILPFYNNLFIPSLRTLYHLYGNSIIKHGDNFQSMVVSLVDGGLGSQMGQYALGFAAAKDSGLSVKYDLSWYQRKNPLTGDFLYPHMDLQKVFPNLHLDIAYLEEAKMYRKYFNFSVKNICVYNNQVTESDVPRYLDGYYVNYRYIQPYTDSLKEMYRFDDSLLSDYFYERVISCECPVALHVRRGDYVNNSAFAKIYDVTTPQYFMRGMKYIKSELQEKPTFFVFSNDMPYCKEMFATIDDDFIFVETENKLRGAAEMALMSKCKHFIISNSSFSWWPAFLADNPNKIVVCPTPWFSDTAPANMRTGCESAMVCDGWIALPTN